MWTNQNILKAKTLALKTYAKDFIFPKCLPPGLSDIKQLELYKKVRKYVPEKYQDILCPKPSNDVMIRARKQKKENRQDRKKHL